MRRKLLGVTDYFAVLGVPRAPWVDGEFLKERFHRLGAENHPDHGGSDGAFAAVNEAWRVLRSPSGCLRHFLELEHPRIVLPEGRAPAELADLFMEIAEIGPSVARFGGKVESATSALARALIEPERIMLAGRLRTIAGRVAQCAEAVGREIRESPAEPARLAQLLNQLAFLDKWEVRVREMSAAL